MKNKNKVLKIFISIIIITIASVVFLLYNKNQKNSEDIIQKNDKQMNDKLEEGVKDINILIEEESSWYSDNLNHSTIQIKINNNSEKDIENWKLIILTNQNITITNNWSSRWICEDNKIIIESLDYNSMITNNSEIKIGANISYVGELKFLDSALYSDEKEIPIAKEMLEINTMENEKEIIQYSKINMEKKSPVKIHGKLSVKGKNVVDKNGDNFQIQGVSTHSIHEFPQFINLNTFKFIKEELNCNTIRICVYSNPEEGYSENLYTTVDDGIEYASKLGLYVILDWHILADNDPNMNKDSAKRFFERMAEKYKDYENILYEICNEPNGDVNWETVKSYAIEMVELIRSINKDAIIIIGNPDYCKDLTGATESPLEDFLNILYSFHFYTGSHHKSMRDRVEIAYNSGLPIIVSEFGLSEYTGNGNIDEEEADIWIRFLREKNIGYICWNISNKNETSALLNSDVQNVDELTEENLSQVGKWIKNKYNE